MKPATGAQLWSLRHILQQDSGSVFEKLALAGYGFVEPAGFNVAERTVQGFTPGALKQLADAHGLQIISAHLQLSIDNAAIACDCAASIGVKYIVRSFFSDELEQTPEVYQRAAEALSRMGTIAQSFGLQLAYHNHAHEFTQTGNGSLFDILLDNTDPELVVFQPDLGWLAAAGQNPVSLFERYPGRFPLWHFRDMDPVTKKATAIGEGEIDFTAALARKELAGLRYVIVEMASGTEDPLEQMLKSRNTIDAWF